jgi:hypothetical protein
MNNIYYLYHNPGLQRGKTLPVGDLRNSNPRVSTRLSTRPDEHRRAILERRSANGFRDELREFMVAENSSGR